MCCACTVDEPARILECALKPLDALGLLWGRACSGLDEEVSLDLGCVTSFHSENRRFRSARGGSREGGRAFEGAHGKDTDRGGRRSSHLPPPRERPTGGGVRSTSGADHRPAGESPRTGWLRGEGLWGALCESREHVLPINETNQPSLSARDSSAVRNPYSGHGPLAQRTVIAEAVFSEAITPRAAGAHTMGWRRRSRSRLRRVSKVVGATALHVGAARGTCATRTQAAARLPKYCTTIVGCPQDPKENSFPTQKGTHEANLMLACSNRSEASSVGGPSS